MNVLIGQNLNRLILLFFNFEESTFSFVSLLKVESIISF